MGEARRRTAEAKKGRRGEVCITQSSAQTYIPWSTVQGYDVGEGIAGQITEPWRCRPGVSSRNRAAEMDSAHPSAMALCAVYTIPNSGVLP